MKDPGGACSPGRGAGVLYFLSPQARRVESSVVQLCVACVCTVCVTVCEVTSLVFCFDLFSPIMRHMASARGSRSLYSKTHARFSLAVARWAASGARSAPGQDSTTVGRGKTSAG